LVSRDGQSVIEAESGALVGNAVVRKPASAWTGESQWSGSFVAAGPGSTVSWALPAADQPRLVQPIAELKAGSPARSVFTVGDCVVGTVRYGAVGAQGNAPSPTELVPVDLPGRAPAGARTVTARTSGGTGNLDALLVIPLVSRLTTAGHGSGLVLLNSVASTVAQRRIDLPGSGRLTIRSYDRNGRLVDIAQRGAPIAKVWPGGFTIATRR
ncbi:MAG: hypothetical protein ACR2M5_03190, partial [Nakamurella sp.]